MNQQTDDADAWNPGLQSDIPTALWPLVTLYRDENAFVSYSEAFELADLTGLKVLELISLRPERLVVHSLLVRVTADLSVPDGPNYEDLGINLRGMVDRIYSAHMLPAMDSMAALLETERARALDYVLQQLATQFDPAPAESAEQPEKPSLLSRLFGRSPAAVDVPAPADAQELQAMENWKQQARAEQDEMHKACLAALVKTVGAVVGHRGRMLPDHDLLARIVVNQVCNTHGSNLIDQAIEDRWLKAVEAEGYRFLPAQSKPVIMNVKGASASGKSTIRPQQRQLSEKLGIPWEDFALISPDYWRKYLLDYNSLGDDYKYGAMLTGRELEIVDKKLDRYMADKASRGTMSHLLIDRFRFDSFIVDVDQTADSTLLSRFGDQVYLFFMVTHPAETVSRAWARGIKTGRYKAVDDLLHHNVEAFTGMPSLFLSWVNSKNKRIHFEFLDNDVAEGSLPRTAAFGWNKTLVVLDIRLLLNIDRYRKVRITARQADEVFDCKDLDTKANTDFVVRCAKTVEKIVLADQNSADEYAVVMEGSLVWWDDSYIERHAEQEGLLEVLAALGYSGQPCTASSDEHVNQINIDEEKRVTVGRWGSA